MFKDLNIKRLAPQMSLREIAKLFHADINHYEESQGNEHLLTKEENEALTKVCQDRHEIPELNALGEMYNVTSQLLNSICTGCIALQLYSSKILSFALTSFHLAKIQQLERGEKKNDFAFSWFSPRESDENTEKDIAEREPNPIIQRLFVHALTANKLIRRSIYMIQFIEKEGRMSFVSDRKKEILNEAEKELKNFSEDSAAQKMLNVYKEMYDKGFMRSDGFTEPLFLEMMKDFKNSLLLNQQEAKEAEERVKRRLGDA